MSTDNIDLEQQRVFQIDRLNEITKVGEEPWVTVYLDQKLENENCLTFSALIPSANVELVLESNSWDLLPNDAHPMIDGKNLTYLRFGNLLEIEPFIIHRNFYGIRKEYNEILEEFRLFHNLHHDLQKNRLLKLDEEGNETIVGKIETKKVEIRSREIFQFLAAKQMHLAIYFDWKRYSSLFIENRELLFEGDSFHYTLIAASKEFPIFNKYKTFSQIYGKKLISPPSLDKCGIWPFEEEKEYFDFIVGCDQNGKDLKFSCNPENLSSSNISSTSSEISDYLTRVFFRREVLTKYYAHPEKYTVEDGFVRCQDLWGLKVDNNHSEYVIVFLGDLGKNLPSKEQAHWYSYNVLPEGQMSQINLKRSFSLEAGDPDQLDLKFKTRFLSFLKKWKSVKGWSLFLELDKADQYLFDALRIPLTNSQSEFDQQILALTKLIIDSINENAITIEVSESISEIKGGISKLDFFLKSHQYPEVEAHIKFLRDLQDIRSRGVAHRKGKSYKKTIEKLDLQEDNRSDFLKVIFLYIIDFLNTLDDHFLSANEAVDQI